MKSINLDNQINFSKKEAESLRDINEQNRIMNRITSSFFNTGPEILDRRSAFLKVATNKRRNK